MAVFRIAIVAQIVQVARHHRIEIAPELVPIYEIKLDPGNFGDRVGFVRGLDRAGQ